jgi:probable addiction module antidote protein
MTTTTEKFDVAEYLVDEETMANYLADCLAEGGITLFLHAMGEVARARGMSVIAADTGLTRASLYKALGEGGNPGLGTIAKVLDTLGFTLSVVPKARPAKRTAKKARKKIAPAAKPRKSTARKSPRPGTAR